MASSDGNGSHVGNKTGIGALLRGEMSLKRAFWLWGFVGSIAQLVVISVLLLALPDVVDDVVGWAVLAWIGFLYIYFAVVLVGIWRVSGRILADTIQGEQAADDALNAQKSAAKAARVMVILGVLILVSMTVQVLFMGGSPH